MDERRDRDASERARAEYNAELAKRLAALLVAGWRRRHGAPEADAQRRDQPRPPAPQELPPAA